jgi:hypothetical protein
VVYQQVLIQYEYEMLTVALMKTQEL